MSWYNWFAKKAPERPPSDEPTSPIYFIAGTPVRFLSSAAVMTAEEALRKCPQLFRVVNYVSASVQSVPWYCEADPDVIAAERAPATTIKAINAVLKSPNDNYTAQSMEYWIAMNLMLYVRNASASVSTVRLLNANHHRLRRTCVAN